VKILFWLGAVNKKTVAKWFYSVAFKNVQKQESLRAKNLCKPKILFLFCTASFLLEKWNVFKNLSYLEARKYLYLLPVELNDHESR
jgi:hypothetical protein